MIQPEGGSLHVANVRGGGEIASGSTASVSLDAVQHLVLYRLYCNDSLVAERPGGSFTGLTDYGHYRVQATYDGHETWMNGSVGVWPVITRYTTGGGGVQTNNRAVEITLSGSEEGLTYRLLRDGNVVETLPGTGSMLRFSAPSTGVYRVEGGLQDHYVAMNGSAEVYRNTTVTFSSTHSYTATRTYLSASGDTWRESLRYVDGLGRPLQDVQVNASPDGSSDLVQPYVYGRGGRVEKSFLPYPALGNCGNFDGGFSNVSNWSVYGAAEQSNAFSLTEYDGSPLNRVVKQTGPGAAWHAGSKGITTAYGYNGADEVRLYRVAADGSLVCSGYYAAGRLEKTTVTDEDGLVTESFTDNEGKAVLTVSVNGNDRLETYTVYDAFGRVCWVLSPEASHRLGTGVDATVLNRYAYRYDYDTRGRLIEKQLPGVEPVYYVYDGKDRAVLSQDGNQRTDNRWSYSIYDVQNRVTETGEVVIVGKTAAQLRSDARDSKDYLPAGTRTPLQYCLYDRYTASETVTPHAFAATQEYAAAYHPLVTGQLTATKTRILGSDAWQTTTMYYDDRGRVIQTVSDNRLGGLSRSDMLYDFTDNLIRQRESHGKTDGSADVLECVNSYDAQGRLLTQSVSLNGGTAATLTYSYDALGRLTGKRYGELDEDITYNLRGWLTGKESTPFRMRLRYETTEGGSTARWNGSLSEWEWQQGTNPAMLYGFTYDGLNRFTSAVQKEKSGSAWTALAGDYVEKGLTYDRNGNLQTLQRTAAGTMVDDLAYTYTGNLLTGLSENVRTAPSNDIYAPGNTASGTYSYDANGNLQNDGRRSLLFDYNSLNLVREVRTGSTVKAAYVWLADGTKLGVESGDGADGFEYVGSLIYRKSGNSLLLCEALFGDGVIRINDNSTQEVNYFLTDHLGSVRVIVDAAGTVKERNDYYPFGARHVRSDYAQSTNRWKYNGKELQTTGDLGYLDYGARMYDAGLGRWFCADLLSESAISLTPYHYCCNDPLNLTDPDGMYADHWMYDLTNGNLSWLSDLGGNEYQFLSFVHPGAEGGYILDKQVSLSGSTFFIGPVSGGLLASNVNYWQSMPSDLSGYRGYRYDLSDLRMRLEVFNGSSHHLKVALSNWESRGIAEPLTSQNYWSIYGHTLGMLNLWSTYLPAGVGLSAGALGGKGQMGPRNSRVVSVPSSTKRIVQEKANLKKDVFIVTKEGVALPRGAKIPGIFKQNRYRNSSYGIFENGRFIEKLRIDAATQPGLKGPSRSHFHLNNKGHIFDQSKWPWYK